MAKSISSPYHLHTKSVSTPYQARFYIYRDGTDLIRRWYGVDTDLVWRWYRDGMEMVRR
ncbi:hypothetical protein [Bacteroides oleiciplenus]|uniref:hypothetical protein n=1 Tax=Bacteroides oleiciplenus TaxID=626931 RepID=UPI0012F7D356|nr:hypothetical protein [Bacteroides oleiciplenus]